MMDNEVEIPSIPTTSTKALKEHFIEVVWETNDRLTALPGSMNIIQRLRCLLLCQQGFLNEQGMQTGSWVLLNTPAMIKTVQ